MFTSKKETKNKASILKMQLITAQHVFVVKTYYKSVAIWKQKKLSSKDFQRKTHKK